MFVLSKCNYIDFSKRLHDCGAERHTFSPGEHIFCFTSCGFSIPSYIFWSTHCCKADLGATLSYLRKQTQPCHVSILKQCHVSCESVEWGAHLCVFVTHSLYDLHLTSCEDALANHDMCVWQGDSVIPWLGGGAGHRAPFTLKCRGLSSIQPQGLYKGMWGVCAVCLCVELEGHQGGLKAASHCTQALSERSG